MSITILSLFPRFWTVVSMYEVTLRELMVVMILSLFPRILDPCMYVVTINDIGGGG